jgi:hypothetical protein
MKIDLSTCSEEELWQHVAVHLEKNGLRCVLVGGSVVSIYTEGLYRSGDLDIIIQNLVKDKLPALMKDLGFKKMHRHYVHPECSHLIVEFPQGPLAIGDETDIKPETVDIGGTTIRLLSPTDCIKDRLASYIYGNTRDALDQAVLVAKRQPFQKSKIKKWCEKERRTDVFAEFI